MHFDPKKYTKNYKMRVIRNKKHKKLREKSRDATKLGRNFLNFSDF